MTIYSISGNAPQIAGSAWVASQATLVGRVELGERTSVWFGAVIRADNEPVKIGAGSNVQEGAVLHTDPGFPLDIAGNVTIGHQAMLHGCTVGEGSLIGIQAVVLNCAVIGKNCLVAAGAIVTEGKSFPDRSLILGAPANVARELSDEDVARLDESAADYARRAELYRGELRHIG
ncbi:gamma carbonic anhydrase family protein [Paraburkholderia panacisoli]|uniref:Gamma carbonic anhydrase family protein n=1 Tax=Paraburkholderia panacisoli TaxID=2603818 RepID=A0A5B0GGG7_9BURK|nr:gamma carbonic anhydrase family protein [Paraburkholderia panacisoli]KAA1000969.1 gamma carbonic anhydrase family protein [Paraburkholderia panacisoli]